MLLYIHANLRSTMWHTTFLQHIVYSKNEQWVDNVYLNSNMEKIDSRTQGAYKKIVDMRESCWL